MGSTIAQSVHTLIFDFDGVFTDNSVFINENGQESVVCDRRDGLGINLLRAYCQDISHNMRLLILSKERNQVVAMRANKLGIEVEHGVDCKASFISSYMDKLGYVKHAQAYKGLAYCGNDINDIEAIKLSEYSYAPGDSHPKVKKVVKQVLPELGGKGFVRRVAEELIGFDAMSDFDIDRLLITG